MNPPTFVAQGATAWNTNTPTTKTLTVTAQAGDRIVVYGAISNSGTNNTLACSGGGLTWTLAQSIAVSSSWGGLYVWTATASTTGSLTVTITKGAGTGVFGGAYQQFRDSDGFGASSKANASGASSLALTTGSANSAIVFAVNDWNSVDGAARAARTGAGAFTEHVYNRNGTTMTVYGGRHADAGAAGSKTIGYTAPTGQKYSIIGVEVLGTTPAVLTGSPNLMDNPEVSPEWSVMLGGVEVPVLTWHVIINGVEVPLVDAAPPAALGLGNGALGTSPLGE